MDDKKIVLAIDDSPQQLENFKLLIGNEYDLRVTPSADTALEFLIKNRVDAILLDIEMPEINGFEFIMAIRDIVRLPVKSVPIIIVSGNNNEAYMIQAKDYNVFDVLTKPVKKEVLIGVIEKSLTPKPVTRHLMDIANL